MNDESQQSDLAPVDLSSETVTALPDKEVASILDLNANLDLDLDAAAPIDLAVAANANVAAPIEASAAANILSAGSTAQSLSDQGVIIDQGITADANAEAAQDSTIDQAEAEPEPVPAPVPDGTTVTDNSGAADLSSALNGNLLNVNVDVAADADLAAPINGAVAANANVAAPIDASVAANIGSIASTATAISQQDAIINQQIDGEANASSDQQSDLQQ